MPDDSEEYTTATHDDGQPAKRKRLRIPKSCLPCLKGKRACDRGRPACGRCARSGQGSDCSYDSRLPHLPASAQSQPSAAYRDSDDDDDDDSSTQDPKGLAALQKQLEEARNETRRLQHLLRSQAHTSSSTSSSGVPPSYKHHSSAWPHASTSADRFRHHSNASDLHAARGLQMLAEIAGPQHQDADSNAIKSRILHWSGPGSHASPSSSTASPSDDRVLSSCSSRPANSSISATSASPADRFAHNIGSSSVYSRPSHDLNHSADGLSSPKNINGTQMYYGDGDKVLRKVAAGTAGSSHTNGSHLSTRIDETMARRDIQSAFNSVLDPSRDTFPFATIWSSGTAFIDEVLPFFPRAEEFDSICASFVRHFSAMCPALTMPNAIDHAKTFSRMTRKQQSQVSLPWLAVFLMICALGKNCDLESTTIGVDRKVRMLGAFLASEASQQPSRHASRASSPAPTETRPAQAGLGEDVPTSTSTDAKSTAMVSDLFLSATYQSLRLCSFLSAPTLQTIHSQLLIGSYLLNTERAASFWPLLGSVARQAQSIGLHVDPSKIKRDWDPVEADTRRRLWWAVVHQDVILSSIFGRPLGITRFSCRFPGTSGSDSPSSVTYAILQCEFSQFARTCLDENQDRSWSQAQIIDFTEKVLQWYMNIPDRYRPDLGPIDLLGSETEAEAIQNYHVAGVDIKTKGLMEVHQSGNLAIEVFYTILSLHRSNLFPSSNADTDIKTSNAKTGGAGELNQVSLHICAQALRRITRAQQIMIDLLGRARATMFWKIAYYTYQAAIAGAYIVFVQPQSKHAESALEDLAILTDFFDRMPEKWTGLKMAKHGLRVLRKLAVAAREMPEAATLAARGSALQPAQSGMESASSPMANGYAYNAQPSDSIAAAAENSGLGEMLAAAATPSSHLLHTPGPSSDASHLGLNSQSGFLPPIFNASFLSPAGTQMMSSTPMINTPQPNPSPNSYSEPTSLFAGALAASAGSPLARSLASVPLVTLFNNTYDQEEKTPGPPRQSFCYDPFIPDPTTTMFGDGSGGAESVSPVSERRTASLGSPSTSLSTHQGSLDGGSAGEKEKSRAAQQQQMDNGVQDLSPTMMNQKDLANYWSEYFSLQLDWDRLTGLA